MEEVKQSVEQACLELQNPVHIAAAEAVLLAHLRDAPHALLACQHILAASVLPEARFHAAVGLKRAIMLRWVGLSVEERLALRGYLLHFIRSTAHDPQHLLVRKHMCAALAVAMKLGWLSDPPEVKAQLLQEMHSMVMAGSQALLSMPAAAANGMDPQALAAAAAQSGDAASLHVGRAGLEVLEAVVEEFSLGSASPLGLPWDFHEKCCRDIEDNYLHGFFATAITLGQQSLACGGVLQGTDGGICRAAIALLAQCMQWEFRRPGAPPILSANTIKRAPGDCSQFAPGQSWSEMLLAPPTLEWVVALIQQIRAAKAGRLAKGPDHLEAIANEARQLFLGFCSLTREVFPRPQPRTLDPVAASPLRHAFLTSLMRVLLPDLHPPAAVLQQAGTQEGQPLLDACRCVAALAATHRAPALQAASLEAMGPAAAQVPGSSAGSGLLGVLEVLSVAAIGAGGARHDNDLEDAWLRECTDMLMDAWCSLLQPEGSLVVVGAHEANTRVPPGTTAAAAVVFQAYVTDALKAAAAEAHQEAEEDEHEELSAVNAENWVCRAASFARSSPTTCLPFLAACLNQAKDGLAFAATTGTDTSEALEQLSWLQRAAAHCMADSGTGEVPMMPQGLAQAIAAGVPGVAEAVICCSEALLAVPALVLNDTARHVMSPRLLEASAWALARWLDTYLFPEEHLPAPLQAVFGDNEDAGDAGVAPLAPGSKGLATLDMVVQVANTCLVAYPGEGALHKQVCAVLLPALVHHQGICRRLLVLPSWQTLASAFAQRQAVLTSGLGLKLQRALAQNLCLAAAGINRSSAAQEYVGSLVTPVANEVATLAQQPNLQELSSRADAAAGLCSCLETLRGATCATLARTQSTLWGLCANLLRPLLTLQRAFKHHTLVVALLLKLASNIVESHVSYLKPEEGAVLLQWVLALLQQYAQDNAWVKEGTASKAWVNERRQEAARDLRALLRLLGHMTQRDLNDVVSGPTGQGVAAATVANSHCHHSGPPGTQHSDVSTAQVVVLGLNILLPLMTTDLLKFPKLCSLYYNLLVYVLENYPDQIAALPAYHFGTLMSSLEYGLTCTTDSMVVGNALEGLAGLARYQHLCRIKGLPGLDMHSPPGGPTVTAAIMERILRLILLEDVSYDLVELSANALQLLILAEPGAYVALAQQLVQQAHQRDPSTGPRLEEALSSLLQAANAGAAYATAASLPKPAQKAFREAACSTVQHVRGIIRLK